MKNLKIKFVFMCLCVCFSLLFGVSANLFEASKSASAEEVSTSSYTISSNTNEDYISVSGGNLNSTYSSFDGNTGALSAIKTDAGSNSIGLNFDNFSISEGEPTLALSKINVAISGKITTKCSEPVFSISSGEVSFSNITISTEYTDSPTYAIYLSSESVSLTFGNDVYCGCKYLFNYLTGMNLEFSCSETFANDLKSNIAYTISFNSNGGSEIASIVAKSGEAITQPTDPTKDNYDFGGWYTDTTFETEYEFYTMPAENLTLYAKWNDYVKTYIYNISSNTNSDYISVSSSYENGITYSLLTSLDTPFGTFANALEAIFEDCKGSGTLTLNFSNFTPLTNEKTISIFGNGTISTIVLSGSLSSSFGAPILQIKTSAEVLVQFKNISFENNKSEKLIEITDTQNSTLSSVSLSFEGATFVSTVENSYAIYLSSDDVKLTFGESVTLNCTYLFNFSENVETNFSSSNETTLKAKIAYEISFEAGGGTIVESIIAFSDATIYEPTEPAKQNYIFGGWYTDNSFTNKFTFSTMPAENVTLYARWLGTYVITINSNGAGEDGSISEVESYDISSKKPADPTKEGHTFAGWYLDNETFSEPFEFDTMPGENITIYAKWTKNSYTIEFSTNGGSEIETASFEYGDDLSSLDTPTKTNYSFVGWFLDENLTTAFSLTAMPAENLKLWAKWQEKQLVTIDETAQTYEYSSNYAFKNFSSLSGFSVYYFVNNSWVSETPTDAGSYNVLVTRAEDETYQSFYLTIENGLVIEPTELDLTWVIIVLFFLAFFELLVSIVFRYLRKLKAAMTYSFAFPVLLLANTVLPTNQIVLLSVSGALALFGFVLMIYELVKLHRTNPIILIDNPDKKQTESDFDDVFDIPTKPAEPSIYDEYLFSQEDIEDMLTDKDYFKNNKKIKNLKNNGENDSSNNKNEEGAKK